MHGIPRDLRSSVFGPCLPSESDDMSESSPAAKLSLIPRAIFDLNPVLRTTSMCRLNVDSETKSLQWEQNK